MIFNDGFKILADHYGFSSQADMLCEEAAGFTVALNKLRRGKAEAYANIKEELADVLVVALQLRFLLGPEEIDKIAEEKLKRQLQRIHAEDHRGDNMTTTTLQKIKAYGKTADKQDALDALLDYYGKDSLEKISEEMALTFLERLENGIIKL